jgi:putative flippase GtrA
VLSIVACHDRLSRLVSPQLLRFGIVGVIGFAVDAGLLRASLAAGLGYGEGRVLSFVIAVLATFLLNRSFTFRGRETDRAVAAELFSYVLLQLGGGVVNYGAYLLAVHVSDLVRAYPELGVALGSIAGMGVNYWTAKNFVFKQS